MIGAENMAEILTIIGLLGLAGLSMWLLPDGAKEIVVSVTSGLLGYLKGVHDGKAQHGIDEKP